MSDQIMAEEMQPETKVAFATRKYSNEEKRKKEQEELDELVKAQSGEVEEEPQEQEAQPANAEEKTFKKRYGDLRRHMQDKEKEFQDQLNELKKQLSDATKKEMKLPKSDEDIEQWAKDYPDVAAIVETIAMKKASEQASALEERMKAIDEMQQSASKEKAEAELMRLHPDFDEIRDSDDFHEWAEQQPKWVQTALYENDNDARSAARAIDLYKADSGLTTKKSKSDKDAAKSVDAKNSRSKPQDDETATYIRESEVNKMSSKEYERRSDEIMEAIRTGKFVYDMSGSAR
jgi:type II secretory pathway pseudopilin PulG